MVALSKTIERRRGVEYYQKFILATVGKPIKKIPTMAELLGSDYAEAAVSFNKDHDERLESYAKKRLEEMRVGTTDKN
jgi:hypothetical protein